MFGYLDAGTGSMVLAAIAGGAAGAGVAVKAGLDKFRRGGRKKGADDTTEAEPEAEATETEPESVESATEA